MEEGRKIPVQVVGPIVGENEVMSFVALPHDGVCHRLSKVCIFPPGQDLDPEELARSLNLAINLVPRENLPTSLPRRSSEGSTRSSRNESNC